MSGEGSIEWDLSLHLIGLLPVRVGRVGRLGRAAWHAWIVGHRIVACPDGCTRWPGPAGQGRKDRKVENK